jgi:outer membrane immunogenic protein
MIRRLLLSATTVATLTGSALAADLPSRQAPPAYVPPPAFSWTGLYLGAQIGYAWGKDSFSAASPFGILFTNASFSPNGVVGGAHAGYNLQIGQYVAGVEGDVDGTSYSGSRVAGFSSVSTKIPVQGSIRLRLGVAFDRALLYVTGGAAFAGFENTYQTFAGFDSISKTRTGWTVGGGIEYALNTNWTIRAEYRYSDYGTFTDYPVNSLAPIFGQGTFVQHTETQHAVRGGLTYKFGAAPAPVVATY